MNLFFIVGQQLKRNRHVALSVYVPAVIILTFLGFQDYVSIGFLTRDPAEIMETHTYIGMISNLGVVLWAAAAAICLFTASVVGRGRKGQEMSLFFKMSGALCTLLLLDDLFLLHERVFPNRLHTPQETVMIGYACLLLTYLGWFRGIIHETEFIFLFSALTCFVIAALADAAGDFDPRLKSHMLEDGFKFLGIIGWLTYFAVTAHYYLQRMITTSPDSHLDADRTLKQPPT